MKRMNLKNEQQAANKVVELTIKGVKFVVTGRTEIIIL